MSTGEAVLDTEKAYLLVMVVEVVGGHTLGLLAGDMSQGRDDARVVEGVHGTLCGVLDRATGHDIDQCRDRSLAYGRHPHRHPLTPSVQVACPKAVLRTFSVHYIAGRAFTKRNLCEE